MRIVSFLLLTFCFLPAAFLNSVQAEVENIQPVGLLWNLQGKWQADGASLRAGDAIAPGELLQPEISDGAPDAVRTHSVLVLLPDGQRLRFTCGNKADCARGFRVPALTRAPTRFQAQMLNQVRRILVAGLLPAEPPPLPRTTPAAKDEEVAVLDAHSMVTLNGLTATLPGGLYSYDLVRLSASATQSIGDHLPLQKKDGPVSLHLPGTGNYELHIADGSGRQRIHLFLSAIPAGQQKLYSGFSKAKETLDDWNETNAGWPVHELLRLYLLSLAQSAAAK
jgi:hypothetical protein